MLGVCASLAAAQEPARARWNAAEMGAVADGKTDNTAIIQKALDAAGKAGGGVVELAAGRYRVDGTLSVPAGVTLQGTYRIPPTIGRKDEKPTGTILLAYAGRGSETGPAFIRLAGNNAVIAGVAVIYPEWKQTDVPPVPYPPCIEATNAENVGIIDCCLLNPYEGIKLVQAARHLVRNVTGYPSRRGIYVDECYDIGKIENVHFWPFGVHYRAEDPYCKWVNTQGVAFELARTDWHYVLNTFCFGYGVGYKFSESKAGSTNGNFLGLGADSCRRAVLVQQAQAPGLLITNGEFVGRWESTDSVCVEIGPKVQGKVSLSNCAFWGPIERCVWMRSPFGQFTAQGCNFVDWDNQGTGAPAIDLEAGKAIVQACTFKEGTQVRVGAKVRSAILAANQADGGFHVENQAGGRTQFMANEPEALVRSPEARLHYRVLIGAAGDGSYVRQWHGRERLGERPDAPTMRWSTPASKLMLPVTPGRAHQVRIELNAPREAISPEAGVYLGGQRLAGISVGESAITAELPAMQGESVTLELRCRGWVPRDVIRGSADPRTLGVSVRSVTVRAKDAPARVFDANLDEWMGGSGDATLP